jgi:hypothetical protein
VPTDERYLCPRCQRDTTVADDHLPDVVKLNGPPGWVCGPCARHMGVRDAFTGRPL